MRFEDVLYLDCNTDMESKQKPGYVAAKEKLIEANRRRAQVALDKYALKPKTCVECGGLIAYERRARGKYCSHSCAAVHSNKKRHSPKRDAVCMHCGKPLVGLAGRKFCSRDCDKANKREGLIANWLAGQNSGSLSSGELARPVRRWLIEARGESCELCGWAERNPTTGLVPVQIDHVDGNYRNNKPENLRLLCPNCHSLTPTYGGLNRGNGRKNRHKVGSGID